MTKNLRLTTKIVWCALLSVMGFFAHAQISPSNGIVYVRQGATGNGSGWNNATGDLQGAINANGVQKVFVEKGTFYATNASFVMKNGVKIYGGFDPGNGIGDLSANRILPNPYNNNGTILSGNYQRSVLLNIFTASNPLDTTAVLDGITLTEGNATSGANAGGMVNTYASPTLNHVVIKSNAGPCGGLTNNYGSPVMTNCYIKGNMGSQVGGMTNGGFSAPVLINTEISNNGTTYSGAIPMPGGIYVDALATLQLINCTVAGNAPFGMKGIGNSGTISNSIVYGLQGGAYQVNYSILDSTLYTLNANSTLNNISPFDLFVDTQQMYRLKVGAVAIDAGKDSLFSGLTTSTKDLGGNARKTGNSIDIGAFEYAVIPAANGIVYVKPAATGYGTGSSWEHSTNDLQGAVNAPGTQQVFVAKGTYYTQLPGLIMKNGVAIYGGFDPDNGITGLNNNRILPGNGGSMLNGNNQHTVVMNNFNAGSPLDSTAILDGFKITNGNSTAGGGMVNIYASPTLSNLLITGNSAMGAIYNAFSAPKLYNTSIVNNSAAGFYHVGTAPPYATLINVTLANNSSGAVYTSSGSVTLKNTLACGGMTGTYTAFNSLIQNSSDTTNGNVNGTGVTQAQLFLNPAGGDYRLLYNAPVINKGNDTFLTGLANSSKDLAGKPRIFADTVDIGAFEFNFLPGAGNIVYVKPSGTGLQDGSSWANATADIQNAIYTPGVQKVFAAVGVYYRTESSLVMKNGVAIYGGFDPDNGIDSLDDARIMPSPTDFSVGSILEANHMRPVIYNNFTAANPLNSSAKIDGFTVAGGNIFNAAMDGGAGIYNVYSSATYNSLVVRDNWGNDVGQGFGGGIYIANYSNPTFNNAYVIRNQGKSVAGIGVDLWSNPVFNNVEISQNTKTGNPGPYMGDAIHTSLSSSTFNNCTIAGNYPDDGGAYGKVMGAQGGGNYLNNCIVTGGRVTGGRVIKSSIIQDAGPNSNVTINRYDVNGTIVDTTLYTEQQLYSDPVNHVFRLHSGSPAINNGSNGYFPGLNANSKDLAGHPRVVGSGIDIGAYEYDLFPGASGIAYVKPASSGLGDGSSWANATDNLQEAIDANGTQKVFVAKGTYQVPSPNSFIMKNGVKIYGGFDPANGIDSLDDARIMPTLGNKGSVLDGKNERPVFWNVFSAANPMDSSTVLDGFTLKNAFGANEGCIHNQYASPKLANLLITDNDNTGIYNIMSSPAITNTAIVGNPGRGLYQKGGNALLRSVTIGGNTGNALSIIAYDVNNPGSIGLTNSVVFGNIAGYNNTNITASYSFIENNAVSGAGNVSAIGWNTDNVFADTANKDYSLRFNVPAINAGSNSGFPNLNANSRDMLGNPRLTDTVIDMGAYEFMVNPYYQSVMYVKPNSTGTGTGNSWANATNKLQKAIDATGTQQVWVAKGNYNIPSPNSSFVMKNNVALYGGFDPDNGIVNLNNTRIMPDTSGTNGSVLNGMNLKPVVWNYYTAANPMNNTAVMDGFALVNGNSSSDGGAMNNRYASPTLRNLVIKNNTANFGGGIFNRYATPTCSEITLLNNTANINGGAVYNDASTLSLSHVVAKNNAAYAGGFMYSTNSSVTASDILVLNNTATNIGGIANVNTYANYTNAAIINNTNGGWEQSDTAATLLNCTIAGNTVYGLKALSDTTTLKNSIIFGLNNSNYTAQSSFIEGSSDTTNANVDATGITPAQLFVNATAGDYHLIPLAPVIGKGNNDLYPGLSAQTQGIAKERRLIGGNIDLGAYEYSLVPDSNGIVYVKDTATGTGDGRSWANATNLLKDAVDATGTQQVWVAKGIYYVDNRSFVMKKNVRIYGGFDPDNGIDDLSDNRIMPDTAGNNGSILDGNNERPVIWNEFPGGQTLTNAELNGFTIQNGYSSFKGGGISNVSNSDAELRNLVVRNCHSGTGGGMYNYDQSQPTLDHVVFYHNSAIASGGGIYSGGGSTILHLYNVSLIGNTALNGGGLYQRDKYSSYYAYNLLVKDNSASYSGGGIFHDTGEGYITQGEITGNTCTNLGSAIYQRTRNITMNNVTVANNENSNTDLMVKSDIYVEWNGDALWEYISGYDYYFQIPECYINNSILFANGTAFRSYQATNCLVKGNWVFNFINGFTNCIDGENIDPEDVFKDPANGDYTLRTSSPAINVGDSTLFPDLDSNSTDMAGNPRVVGRQIDLGAYELQLNITPDANGIAYVKPIATGNKTGDSWANATDNIPEAIKGTGTQQVWVAKGNYPIRGIGFAMKNGVKIYGGFDPDNGISTLNDTRIMPAELPGGGGGSVLDGRNKQPVILNLFSGTAPLDTTAQLDGFTIANGSYDFGSGMMNKHASPVLRNLVFKNNAATSDGGGIYNDSTCAPVMNNIVIIGNKATYGGGMFNRNAAPVMKNVWLKNDTAVNNGGGMYNNNGATPAMTNVAITGNSATEGAGMFNDNASPSLTNATIAGNIPDALSASNSGNTFLANSILFGTINGNYAAQNSLIEGDSGGTNGNLNGTNILMSQVFADSANNDYSLKNTSPAIDTGNNALFAGLETATLDLSGNHRLVNGVIDLGAFEFNDNNVPTPIKLLSFTAEKQQETALLQWTTVNEQSNKGFELQHSTDSRTWEALTFVPSKAKNGNSQGKLDYQYVHQHPTTGHNFYRLKQIDFDGKAAYSPVRMLVFNSPEMAINLYPNPAKEQITITGLEGGETILFLDALGRKVKEVLSKNTEETISVAELNAGMYHLLIKGRDSSVYSMKLVIRK